MASKIQRVLFWFKDGNEQLLPMDRKFYPWGVMLTRLLNEAYEGKKIKLANLYFKTDKTYELHPSSVKHNINFSGGMLLYNDVIDLAYFNVMPEIMQKQIIWKRAYEIFQAAADKIKEVELKEAAQYAYEKGMSMDLNPDFEMLHSEITLHGKKCSASLQITFMEDSMCANLLVKYLDTVILDRFIEKAELSNEFFLEIFKKIESDGKSVILKGRKEVGYLPLKIEIGDAALG